MFAKAEQLVSAACWWMLGWHVPSVSLLELMTSIVKHLTLDFQLIWLSVRWARYLSFHQFIRIQCTVSAQEWPHRLKLVHVRLADTG